MANAYGIAQTSFRRKIQDKYFIILKNGTTFTKHAPTGVGTLSYRFRDTTCLQGGVPNNLSTVSGGTYLIDYLCVMGLPFVGVLGKEDQSLKPLTAGSVQSALTVGLYRSLRLHKHFNANLSFLNGLAYANKVDGIYRKMASTGNRIHHTDNDLKYLLERDRKYSFTKLFERKGNYIPRLRSSKTEFTDYSNNVIIPDAMEFFLGLKFEEVEISPTDLVITSDDLSTIKSKRDLYILMSHLKGMNAGSYVIRVEKQDIQYSRIYSIFTSIKSQTRKDLGFNNYDIDACMQSITFNFINVEKYPLHKALLDDKIAFRGKIMEELDTDYKRVKKLLSASDNGQNSSACNKSDTLMDYKNETSGMVNEFLETFEKVNPAMYRRADSLAKYEYRRKWNKTLKQYDFIPLENKNRFSVYFFCWTQIEREIRDVMKSCFSNIDQVYDVHDACYSREIVSLLDMEEKIQNQLGMKIGISH